MRTPKLALILATANLLAASVAVTAAAQDSASKDATRAATAATAPTLPHDIHDGLTVQADVYTDRGRSKQKFGKADPFAVGVLPVEVTFRNSTDQPLRVDISTIQLEVRLRSGGRQDLDWLAAEDVAALIAHPAGAGAPSSRPRIGPLPIPSGDKKADKLAEILKPLTLNADTIPPMGSIRGFVYFNVSNDIGLADDAVLYIPDVVMLPTKKALMFYEVQLGKSSPN